MLQDRSGVGFWRKGFVAVGEDGKVTYSNNGPCYGECGNGDRFRTQGVPKKSKELDYVHVLQVKLDFKVIDRFLYFAQTMENMGSRVSSIFLLLLW